MGAAGQAGRQAGTLQACPHNPPTFITIPWGVAPHPQHPTRSTCEGPELLRVHALVCGGQAHHVHPILQCRLEKLAVGGGKLEDKGAAGQLVLQACGAVYVQMADSAKAGQSGTKQACRLSGQPHGTPDRCRPARAACLPRHSPAL